MKKILVIDDDRNIRHSIKYFLANHGYKVDVEGSLEAGFRLLGKGHYDVLIIDICLGDESGLNFSERFGKKLSNAPIVYISGEATLNDVAKAIKLGASDFLEKPFDLERLLFSVERSIRVSETEQRLSLELKNQFLGESAAMREILLQVQKVAPTDAPVLLLGENGTGKDKMASHIHSVSSRSGYPIVKVNCASVPDSLFESEMFGHIKGAFTGAERDRSGFFLQANGGTIFLDEIGELSAASQAKLLRALENHEIQRLGEEHTRQVDIRVISATNRDLQAMVESGEFREDLYFRLNTICLRIPPLRERSADIEVFLHFFLQQSIKKNRLSNRSFSTEALDELKKRSWPGNLRQLKNEVERASIISDGEIQVADLSPELPRQFSRKYEKNDLVAFLSREERKFLVASLVQSAGNISQTSRDLGITRATLHKKINDFGISKREYL